MTQAMTQAERLTARRAELRTAAQAKVQAANVLRIEAEAKEAAWQAKKKPKMTKGEIIGVLIFWAWFPPPGCVVLAILAYELCRKLRRS